MKRTLHAAAVIVAGVTAVSCLDRPAPLAPVPDNPGDSVQAPSQSYVLGVIKCSASTTAPASLTCGNVDVSSVAEGVILGGENTYVRVETANPNYDAGAQVYTADVTLRNLIEQALGTSDGTTLDADGIKIFFQTGPTVTSGTGTITVDADGLGTFMATAQPYFQVNTVLDAFEVSPVRQWRFEMPPTVIAFDFTVYVWAPVQYPEGYITISPAAYTIKPDSTRNIVAEVKSASGNVIAGAPVTWTTADTTIALVNPTTGQVTGVRSGTVNITATNGTRVRSITVDVTGTQRFWRGTTNTDFDTRTNWIRQIVPTALDTIVLPDTAVQGILLARNVTVLAVDVRGHSIDQSAFDLTVNGFVIVVPAAQITSTTGRLILAGIGQNHALGGIVPQLRVTGFYLLSNNVTVKSQIQIIGGRLTNAGFRLQQNP